MEGRLNVSYRYKRVDGNSLRTGTGRNRLNLRKAKCLMRAKKPE
jgi:hypothetical protein